MKTFSTKMALVNKDWYEKDGVKYFSTLARDPFFTRAMAEYCYGYFKNHPKDKLNIFEIGPGDGNFFRNFTNNFIYLCKEMSYVGIDFSRKNAFSVKPKAHPIIAEMGHLPIRDNSQDLGFALETLDDSLVEFLRKRNDEIEIKVEGEKYIPLKDLGDVGKNISKTIEEMKIDLTKEEQPFPIGLIRTIAEVYRILAPEGLFIATDWFHGKDLPFKEPYFTFSKGTFTSYVDLDVIRKLSEKYGLDLEVQLLRNFLEKTDTGKIEGVMWDGDNCTQFTTNLPPSFPHKPKPYYKWFSEDCFHVIVLKKSE